MIASDERNAAMNELGKLLMGPSKPVKPVFEEREAAISLTWMDYEKTKRSAQKTFDEATVVARETRDKSVARTRDAYYDAVAARDEPPTKLKPSISKPQHDAARPARFVVIGSAVLALGVFVLYALLAV